MSTTKIEKSYPAITLWNPWATWIWMALKTIETRRHNRLRSLAGQWVAIHASKRWDDDAFDAAGMLGQTLAAREAHRMRPNHAGRIVCMARVAEHRRLSAEDSVRAMCPAEGLFGLCFDRIARMTRPIAVCGHQGIWTWWPNEGTTCIPFWRNGAPAPMTTGPTAIEMVTANRLPLFGGEP